VSEYDAMIERAAREEQEELDRAQGQHILNIYDARYKAGDRLADAINRAHRAKAEADKQ
jgi:hypothetical protein